VPLLAPVLTPLLGAAGIVGAIPAPPLGGFQLGPLDVRFYGVLIAFGAYLALRWTIQRYEAQGGEGALAERAALGAILFGFLGARLGYVLPRLDRFIDRPLEILAIWQGGLALFGGLLAGTLAVVLITRRGGGDVRAMADAVAPGLPLAQAIGRWGNYFNQELYGRPTDLPWALEVEAPFRRPGFAGSSTFHPTFLYESLWNLALVALLLRIDRRRSVPRGALILVYAVGYGLGRFLIELLRIDTVERYAGLSRNNWIALALVLAGTAALLRLRGRAEDGEEGASDAGAKDASADAATDAGAEDASADTDAGNGDAADVADGREGPSDAAPGTSTLPEDTERS
jgi:prolipoprotein diacylglyceryl transferase